MSFLLSHNFWEAKIRIYVKKKKCFIQNLRVNFKNFFDGDPGVMHPMIFLDHRRKSMKKFGSGKVKTVGEMAISRISKFRTFIIVKEWNGAYKDRNTISIIAI